MTSNVSKNAPAPLPQLTMPESASGVLDLLQFPDSPSVTTTPVPRPLLWLNLEGEDSDGNEVLEKLVEGIPFSIEQLQTGLNEIIPRQTLMQLANNSNFRIRAKISFDSDPDESTATPFEPLELRIINEDRGEVTTFDDQTLGGWEPGPGGQFLEFRSDPRGGYFLLNQKASNNPGGIVLVKDFTVTPGKSYEFSIETRKESSESDVPAKLKLFMNDLNGAAFSIQSLTWTKKTLTLASVASSTLRVGIINDPPGWSGNEYALDNLRVRRLEN